MHLDGTAHTKIEYLYGKQKFLIPNSRRMFCLPRKTIKPLNSEAKIITGSLSHCRSGKTTAIRRIADRQTGVSRHHGGSIEGSPEIPQTSQYYRIEGLKEWPLIWTPLRR